MPTETEQRPIFHATDGEAVAGEPWYWVARYADGSHLAQFDAGDRTFHRFSEIDPERLETFVLQAAFAPSLRFELPLRTGMRPIHFYRNRVLNAGTPEEVRVRLYCFGHQRTLGGRNVKTILEVYPTGTVKLVEE
jgi:hypothetical protein